MMSSCLNGTSKGFGKDGRCKHVWFNENRSLPVTEVPSIDCMADWEKLSTLRIGYKALIRNLIHLARQSFASNTIRTCVW